MNPRNPLDTFFHEAEDLLQQIEDIALQVCGQASAAVSEDSVNSLFRAFHTIKGSSSMFGLDEIAGFTHHVESALDLVRSGRISMSSQLAGLVLEARDVIKELLATAMGGGHADAATGAAIVISLRRLCNIEEDGVAHTEGHTQADVGAEPASGGSGWKIRFRPPRDMVQRGMNPAALFRELGQLGSLQIEGHTDAIPPLDELNPNELLFHWDLRLVSDCSLEGVRDVFIFVEDDSEIVIEPLEGRDEEPSLAASATSTAAVPATALEASPAKHGAERSPVTATVRVAADKLDRLVGLVGELVINQARLTRAASRRNDQELSIPVEEIERLVSELRDSVLGIRMTPIGATFNRFKRLVHDLSTELGKEIDLITEGAETELDKTVLDQLGDPLVHLIRNSLDHGIERTDVREQHDKPRRGVVRLSAAHVGSNVVVRIADDGKGLDAERIRTKAVEKQLLAADASLPESEIFKLIFLPGFSTAQTVTSVSGRGVGMDVVKRQIEALRGTIDIQSVRGEGTTISLTLPLTLAIIDGLLIEIADDQFIIPMSAVTESVELTRQDRGRNNGRNVFAVRGELIPYIDLRANFKIGGRPPDLEKIVIVRHQDQRVGLTVDHVLGSHQTVIQSLGRFYKDTEVVSGATITGDGRVALILDIAGLVRFANRYDPDRPQNSVEHLMPASTGRGQVPLTQ